VTEERDEVARIFQRYNLVSVPVVDEADRLVGVITIDDIVDVIREEADVEVKALGGVSESRRAIGHGVVDGQEPVRVALR
jgi:magnesium transporter